MDAVPITRPTIRRQKNIIVEEHLDAVSWPQECATCGGPVEQTDTLSLKSKFKNLGEISVSVAGIPYCQTCFHKIRWGKRLNQIVLIVAIAIAIAITLSLSGWVFLRGLGKYERFPHDRAAKGFVVRLYKGQPRRVEATPPSPILGTPLADLERLRSQGMISDEEYERKRKELGAS